MKARASEKANKRRYTFWLFFGIAMLIYYAVIILMLGFRISLSWVWLAGGIISIFISVMLKKFGRIPLPKPVMLAINAIVLAVLLLFSAVECAIIGSMGAVGVDGIDCIIVLGAHLNNGDQPSSALRWRIEKARQYLEKNPNTVAILSGGMGSDETISEAECIRRSLESSGIAPERLIIEDKSEDTNENIRNSLSIISKFDGIYDSIGIVTNNFHIFRAVHIAKALTDADIYGLAAPYKNGMVIHYMVREFAGIIVELIEGNMVL